MVSFVVYDDKIAFQTSDKLEKFYQIAKNKQVALCFTNINIQGEAVIKAGQALEHKQFATLFELKHKSSFDCYSHMNSNKVIEIIPQE